MTSAPVDSSLQNELEAERRLANTLHDLRTPLNQIIGLSEMLIEIAEEDGHHDLLGGLNGVREAGLEITSLLADRRLIATAAQPGHEYWPLTDATRAAISRVLGFAEIVLAEPPNARLDAYRDDLALIRTAGRHFLDFARTSGLLIRLESGRHWDTQSPVARQAAAGSPVAGGRVLIVDDEGLNREVLVRRLQREGYRPTGARSGREALEMLHHEAFDAVLLDIQMPEMSGIEVLQAVKQDPELRHLPVIMLSALTDVERVARCVELGAEDYLPKPINAVLLRARLGACLEKKRLRDQEQAHVERLHAETERLSVTLRSLADAVVTTDAAGRIVLFNDVAVTLTGRTREAAVGRAFEEVFPFFDSATGEPAASVAAEALAQKAVVESAPGLLIRSPEGQERIISARAAPIHDHVGAVRGTVVVVRDVTEKEKMAEEVLRASKLQSIGVLAGGLAHDFNNMLTAVLGNLSLLGNLSNLPDDSYPLLCEAERGAFRAKELTQYLLTFADGGAPVKQVVEVRELIERTATFALGGSNVQCDYQLAADLWPTEADPNQLAQVIGNVVLNAIEATPNGGSIVVRATNVHAAPQLPAGEYLCLAVEDRGAGIAPEHLSRIYDPFFTTKKQARGLGLAAAYSIIRRHGGHIAVESNVGLGTTVTLYLPAYPLRSAAAPVLAPATQDPAEVPGAEGRHRVLLMDDEESIRRLAGTMLSLLECEVVETADGEAALAAHEAARAEGHPFDVVVMDLTIPGGMGGKEAIRRLRERDPQIRAIVSSGYSNDPVMAQYGAYGFDGVLPKPYLLKDLKRVLREVEQLAR